MMNIWNGAFDVDLSVWNLSNAMFTEYMFVEEWGNKYIEYIRKPTNRQNSSNIIEF